MSTAAATAAPTPGSVALASVPVRRADVTEMMSLADLPGLPARLASMAAELRLLAHNYPLWTMPATGLGDAIEQAQAVREMAHSLTAMMAAEVDGRGLADEAGLSRNDWVAGFAPGLEGGSAAAVTAVGSAMNEPRWNDLSRLVRRGAVSVDKAAVIVRFHRDVERVADPAHLAAVVDSMVEGAEALGVKELRRLVAQARASLRPPEQVEDGDQRMRAGRSLTKVGRCAGMTDYLLRMDPEGSAIIDAAIDPLARPRPDLDWSHYGRGAGEAAPLDCGAGEGSTSGPGRGIDPRPATTRRADALLELIGRAVSSPDGVPRTPRTKLVVTMSHEALVGLVQGAGVADNDEVLSAATVRRLACEAEIIPMVLGAPSEVLDLGMTTRFFTPAQRLALTRRDGGCSYPGCTVPPQWCDAHHVVPWSRGGPTDVCNGALLCGRHHTIVHQLDLTATVTLLGVEWHVPRSLPADVAATEPRSFDRRATAVPAAKPPEPGRVTGPVRARWSEAAGAAASPLTRHGADVRHPRASRPLDEPHRPTLADRRVSVGPSEAGGPPPRRHSDAGPGP
ncbi:DUF222 domain-containing protein [Terrabacter sp. GCM10028922]|uniref:HNH endonuclease signature motif containing protein n=1 Tax=Terrabacter sp. GCM10028922 TaxID=3273428 RepID=UPI003611DA25